MPAEGAHCVMDTSNATNSYMNYGFWALGLIAAVAITVGLLISR